MLTLGALASLAAFGFFFLPMQRVANGPPTIGVAPVVVAEPWIETPLPIQAVVPVWRIGTSSTAPASPSALCAAQATQPTAPAPAPAWVWPGAKLEAKSIVRWGDEALSRGYVEAARQIYEYAAVVMRWPSAALALAATYAPHELVHLAPSVAPEPEKARLWYERSRELMNARIDFHFRRLGPPKVRGPASASYLVASCR